MSGGDTAIQVTTEWSDGRPSGHTRGTMAADQDPKAKGTKDHDVVLVQGPTEDGQGMRALRSRPGRLDLTELRPTSDGKPLNGAELVRLKPRAESPALWDVDVQYADAHATDAQATDAARSGPPRVASAAYRRNWDAAFGKSPSRTKRRSNPN